jgi:hypothetical protein
MRLLIRRTCNTPPVATNYPASVALTVSVRTFICLTDLKEGAILTMFRACPRFTVFGSGCYGRDSFAPSIGDQFVAGLTANALRRMVCTHAEA